MTKRLTRIFDETDHTILEDYLSCMMATIEDGLLQSGFVPEKDYTRKDLLNAALPFVMQSFNEGKLKFTTAWPKFMCEEQTQ